MDTHKPHDNEQDLSSGSLRDHFLIAMPGMQDPRFAHSITYICDHSAAGAMGLVLNNTMSMSLGDILKQLDLDTAPSVSERSILAGGPVQVERGFVLHNDDTRWQSTLPVADDIGLTASRDILDAIAGEKGPEHYLVALGYAGWEAEQLEDEIAANAWLTMPANREILFHTPSEQRWAAAANHLGFDLNLISSTAGHA